MKRPGKTLSRLDSARVRLDENLEVRNGLDRPTRVVQPLDQTGGRCHVARTGIEDRAPGLDCALQVAGLFEQAGEPQPEIHAAGLSLDQGFQLRDRLRLAAQREQKLDQAFGSFPVQRVQLEGAAPCLHRAFRVLGKLQSAGEPLDRLGLAHVGIDDDAQVGDRRHAFAACVEQIGKPDMGWQSRGIAGEHLAPGVDRGGDIAGLLELSCVFLEARPIGRGDILFG